MEVEWVGSHHAQGRVVFFPLFARLGVQPIWTYTTFVICFLTKTNLAMQLRLQSINQLGAPVLVRLLFTDGGILDLELFNLP